MASGSDMPTHGQLNASSSDAASPPVGSDNPATPTRRCSKHDSELDGNRIVDRNSEAESYVSSAPEGDESPLCDVCMAVSIHRMSREMSELKTLVEQIRREVNPLVEPELEQLKSWMTAEDRTPVIVMSSRTPKTAVRGLKFAVYRDGQLVNRGDSGDSDGRVANFVYGSGDVSSIFKMREEETDQHEVDAHHVVNNQLKYPAGTVTEAQVDDEDALGKEAEDGFLQDVMQEFRRNANLFAMTVLGLAAFIACLHITSLTEQVNNHERVLAWLVQGV